MSRFGKSQASAADHATRYETLRCYALERHGPPSRDGLVILLRHGMAAWINAWSKVPVPRPEPVQAHKSLPMPDEASVEVVHVLATMTLSHFQEAYP
jgi:hypothetical protein